MTGETTASTGPGTTVLIRPDASALIKPKDISAFRRFVSDLVWSEGQSSGEQVINSDPITLRLVRQADAETITVEYFQPAGHGDFQHAAVATFTKRERATDFSPEELADLDLEPLAPRPVWDFHSLALTQPNRDSVKVKLVHDEIRKKSTMEIDGTVDSTGVIFKLIYDYGTGRLIDGDLKPKLGGGKVTKKLIQGSVTELTESDIRVGATLILNTGTDNFLLRAPYDLKFNEIIVNAFPKDGAGLPTLTPSQGYAPSYGKHWLNEALKIRLTKTLTPVPL